MNTPDKVDKIVEEFTVGLSTGQYVIDEAWLRATLTQYHQDMMIEMLKDIDLPWLLKEQERGEFGNVISELERLFAKYEQAPSQPADTAKSV